VILIDLISIQYIMFVSFSILKQKSVEQRSNSKFSYWASNMDVTKSLDLLHHFLLF